MNIKDVSFERERPDVCGDAHPKALLKAIQEDGDYLLKLANQHIVSVISFLSKACCSCFAWRQSMKLIRAVLVRRYRARF